MRCEAPDLELLFVEWLNAIIYEMAVRKMLFSRFSVRIDGNAAHRHAVGRAVDVARHAARLRAERRDLHGAESGADTNGIWSAACVVDV